MSDERGRPKYSTRAKWWAAIVVFAGVWAGSARAVSHPGFSALFHAALTIWVVAQLPRILGAFVEPFRIRSRGALRLRLRRRGLAGWSAATAAILAGLLPIAQGADHADAWAWFGPALVVAAWCVAWSYLRKPGAREKGLSLPALPVSLAWESIPGWRRVEDHFEMRIDEPAPLFQAPLFGLMMPDRLTLAVTDPDALEAILRENLGEPAGDA